MSTNSPTEGVALLYIMHSVAAVVLDNRAREQASFDVARSLLADGDESPSAQLTILI